VGVLFLWSSNKWNIYKARFHLKNMDQNKIFEAGRRTAQIEMEFKNATQKSIWNFFFMFSFTIFEFSRIRRISIIKPTE